MSFATRGVLEVVDADGVRLLRFDRPEALNAFSQALWEAVTEALADAAEDDTTHCVVLTGNGRAFTAGMDLTEMADTEALAKLDQAINAVKATLEDGVDIDELEQRLAAELLEYGPLSSLMRDDAIREINVTGAGPIHVVRDGELGSRLENLRFTVPRALGLAIRRLARKRGLWFEGAQIIEGVVDHGFHMHALLPPHQGRVPVLCLRRIKTDAKSLAALVSFAASAAAMASAASMPDSIARCSGV